MSEAGRAVKGDVLIATGEGNFVLKGSEPPKKLTIGVDKSFNSWSKPTRLKIRGREADLFWVPNDFFLQYDGEEARVWNLPPGSEIEVISYPEG